MLLNLSLDHFVIVDHLELHFEEGFTALTGETGAGKSITLDALGLLLGDKADFSQVRSGQKEAKLSALFSLENLPQLRADLIEQGLMSEDEEELAIRRIISAEGKSRNFINGQTATVAQLKKIGESLIDIHGQNTHHSLNSESTQREILDAFSGCLKTTQSVKQAYQQWQEAKNALHAAQTQSEQLLVEKELLERHQKELSELNPQKDEWESLSQQYDILANAADLLRAAENTHHMIDGEQGLQVLTARCMREMESLSNIEPNFAENLQLLASVEAELGEISNNLRDVMARIDIDGQKLSDVDERMSQWVSLSKKHRVEEIRLPEKWTEIQNRLQSLEVAADLDVLTEKVRQAEKVYRQEAQTLSKLRQQGAKQFSQEITQTMHTLSMEGAVFQVALNPCEASSYGLEKVQYQIAMNQGSDLRPLNKVASGGELARISLAIQVVASRYTSVPTLIFDEVDTGIGGRVAEVVGQCLAQLGKNYQILAVTHLAQVAASASHHWQVSKHEENGQTISEIQVLDKEARIAEIARMIGGKTITQTTINHAKEMLGYE